MKNKRFIQKQNNRYAFSLNELRKDRTPDVAPQRYVSQEEFLEMVAGTRQPEPGSQEARDIQRAENGEIMLDNLWTPGDTFTTDEWQKNLDDVSD